MLYKIVKTLMGTEQVFTLEYCVANAVKNIGQNTTVATENFLEYRNHID